MDMIQLLCLSGRNRQSSTASDELSMSISAVSRCALDINLDSVRVNSFLLNHPKAVFALGGRLAVSVRICGDGRNRRLSLGRDRRRRLFV